tara:strand:+ start:829 stop:1116 length:288 start_codon:yes stop_codon:yes gene_type:complete
MFYIFALFNLFLASVSIAIAGIILYKWTESRIKIAYETYWNDRYVAVYDSLDEDGQSDLERAWEHFWNINHQNDAKAYKQSVRNHYRCIAEYRRQ